MAIETIIEQMQDAIIGLDEQHQILFVNPVMGKLIGLLPKEMIGKNALELALASRINLPGGKELLRDIRGPGDMIGAERFLGSPNYPFSAKTNGDVVVYALQGLVGVTRRAGKRQTKIGRPTKKERRNLNDFLED